MLFLDNMAVIVGFLTLQDKHNIWTLSDNIKFICARYETGQKITDRQMVDFVPISKAASN